MEETGYMKSHRQDDRRLAEQTAGWIAALESGACSREAFFSWLKESPRHVAEVLLLSALTGALAEMRPETRREMDRTLVADSAKQANVIALETNPPVPRSTRKSSIASRWRLAGLAAALMALTLLGFWLTASDSQEYTTQIGEQRALELEDGSIVHLNTQSRLVVRLSSQSRDIRLLSGEALFNVRHDAKRPFRVHTPEAVIEALGTQFNVYHRAAGTKVSVIEGLVRVANDGAAISQPVKLAAGEETDVSPAGRIENRQPLDFGRAVAWRQRRLVFHRDTLESIAAEFNRYNRRVAIRLEGAVSERRFSGAFDADAPESLARALANDSAFEVEKHPDRIVIRPGT
jgi:transmembrane sensor